MQITYAIYVTMNKNELLDILPSLLDATIIAGDEVMRIYEKEKPDIQYKKDNSPVTEADLAANKIITDSLNKLTPYIPVISEEALVPYDERKDWNEYWILDPIDGTKEFIKKSGEFTINIGFLKDGIPQFGILYIPVTKELYYGGLLLDSAYKGNKTRRGDPIWCSWTLGLYEKIKITCSKDHKSPFYHKFYEKFKNRNNGGIEEIPCGSTIKIAQIAEGKAHIYVRLSGINDWDLAAGHAIILGAGGAVYDIDMKRLEYNTESQRLNPFVIVGLHNLPWYNCVPEELRN